MKKIAVVTGASSGMGREAAVQLADQFGWLDEIWLIARREERLSRLRKELPCPSRIFELDLTKQTALSALSAALEEEQPRIVFLVNAAGYGKIGRVGEVSLSEEMGMPAFKLRRPHRRHPPGSPLYGSQQPDSPVRLLRGLPSPARLRRLRSNQGLCIELQPRLGRGGQKARNLRDSRLPGTCKDGIF